MISVLNLLWTVAPQVTRGAPTRLHAFLGSTCCAAPHVLPGVPTTGNSLFIENLRHRYQSH
jgi:hypothetical protein